MIIGVFLLVALGLNISNQSINELTLEEQGAIFALGLEKSAIVAEVFGQSYVCDRDRLYDLQRGVTRQVSSSRCQAEAYLRDFSRVFNAVFRPDV
ncbi:MAG: hypothetical protein GXY34_02700 [Syntrophomonadaceae bacterium]|nr:hypothetical protein [Syntrophomonadaceae bacterium]